MQVNPSSITKIRDAAYEAKGITLYLKRDDLIHPVVSGNKWRKLKYNLEKALHMGHDTVLTFGGAFSNHIAATAYACQAHGMKSVGIIRGEIPEAGNPTLDAARANGMQLKAVSREQYRDKSQPYFRSVLREEFGAFYLVPEGGANHLGVAGCMEILKEADVPFDRVAVACGTGTTVAGLALSLPDDKVIDAFPVLRNADWMAEDVRKLMRQTFLDDDLAERCLAAVHWHLDHHCGGYAKSTPELLRFMRGFYEKHQIKTDPVYTGKLLYGLHHMIEKGAFPEGTNILAIHTGGLQGIAGFEQQNNLKIYP